MLSKKFGYGLALSWAITVGVITAQHHIGALAAGVIAVAGGALLSLLVEVRR